MSAPDPTFGWKEPVFWRRKRLNAMASDRLVKCDTLERNGNHAEADAHRTAAEDIRWMLDYHEDMLATIVGGKT